VLDIDRASTQSPTETKSQAKKIVLLSDGTGNSAGKSGERMSGVPSKRSTSNVGPDCNLRRRRRHLVIQTTRDNGRSVRHWP